MQLKELLNSEKINGSHHRHFGERIKYGFLTYVGGGEQLEQSCTMTCGQVLDMNVITNLWPPKLDPL
jgi:hypothetical protein